MEKRLGTLPVSAGIALVLSSIHLTTVGLYWIDREGMKMTGASSQSPANAESALSTLVSFSS